MHRKPDPTAQINKSYLAAFKFVYQESCSLEFPIEATMDPSKKPPAKCLNDAFRKGSTVLSFVSILLIVALFLRMETINRRTTMNELRISDVESHLKITVLMKSADKQGEKSKGR